MVSGVQELDNSSLEWDPRSLKSPFLSFEVVVVAELTITIGLVAVFHHSPSIRFSLQSTDSTCEVFGQRTVSLRV